MGKRSKVEKLFTIVPVVIFVVILAVMLLLAVWTTAGVEEEMLRILRTYSLAFFFLLPVFAVLFWIWVCVFVRKAKKAAEKESVSMEFFEVVEGKRETILYLYEFTVIIMCLGYFIFCFLWYEQQQIAMFLLGVAAYILPIFLIEIQIRSLKKIIEKYFPQQKGNVYGSAWYGFSLGEWMRTSDEGEQMMVYKAAYRTYRKVKLVCFFLAMFFGILTANGDLSPGPLTVTALFWVLLNSIFYYERNRLKIKSWEDD